MYMTGQTNNTLYALDSTTGAATRIGTTTDFGTAGITAVQGSAWHNGKLYLLGTTSAGSDGIFTVDTTTGVATHIAQLRDAGVGTTILSGITSHAGSLYLTATGTGKLFKTNLSGGTLNTGDATQLGSDNFGSINETKPVDIASHNNKLYMIGADTDKLYEINTTTGTQPPQ